MRELPHDDRIAPEGPDATRVQGGATRSDGADGTRAPSDLPAEATPWPTPPSAGPTPTPAPSSTGGEGRSAGSGTGTALVMPEGELAPGMILFGRYRLEERVGEGGMGTVWRVTHMELDSTRALKLIATSIARDPKVRARFRREAQVMARLSHPHAVTVHDAQLAVDAAYIEMEYVRGKSLSKVLRPRAPMPLDWVARILAQICEVLQTAHDLGVVHRDLKPSNLMLLDGRREGREYLKMLDFGIAKILGVDAATPVLGDGSGEALTQAGSFLGTTPYASPEQIQGQAVDGRSDLYSLGVLLYEMLTGSRPFSGTNELVMASHLMFSPPAFAAKDPSCRVPEAIERVVLSLLAKSPADRPATARDLAEAFEAAMIAAAGEIEGTSAPGADSPEPTSAMGHWAPAEGVRGAPRDDPGGSTTAIPSTFAGPAAAPAQPPPTAEREPAGDRRRRGIFRGRKGITLALAGIAIAAAAVGGARAFRREGRGKSAPDVANGRTHPAPKIPADPRVGPSLESWKGRGISPVGPVADGRWPDSLKGPEGTYGKVDDGGHYLPESYRAEGPERIEGWPLWIVRDDGARFRRVPGGSIRMALYDPLEVPGRRFADLSLVELSGFYIQAHEVTNGEFRRYALEAAAPCPVWREYRELVAQAVPDAAEVDRYPAAGVPWRVAADFARRRRGRLPSEAQWEYVARSGGGPRRYAWDRPGSAPKENPREFARLDCRLEVPPTAPVGSSPDDVNDWGVFDLTGNLREWCRDEWTPDGDPSATLVDPEHPPAAVAVGLPMVVRGGGCFGMGSEGVTTRVKGASLDLPLDDAPADKLRDVGFRLVIECPEPVASPSPGTFPRRIEGRSRGTP